VKVFLDLFFLFPWHYSSFGLKHGQSGMLSGQMPKS
jgi:hypothetical protein